MAINVAEITSVLKREIQAFEQKLEVSEVGTVIEVGDGIARVYGLRNAMAGELLEFENGTMGQVFNLEDEAIGAEAGEARWAGVACVTGRGAALIVAVGAAAAGDAGGVGRAGRAVVGRSGGPRR